MFKKIVSNLPFSPALVDQLGFYIKRLKGEEVTRRIGLFFVALALIAQSLSVFQPPQSANASNEADMILGGVKSLNEILSAYDNNTRNFKFIMNRVGITRDELSKTKYGSYTVGERLTWALTSHFSYDEGEREFGVYNDSSQLITKIYSRPHKLGAKCTDCTKTGWIGSSEKLGWFAIRDLCGNLISDIIPPLPKKCPYNAAILASDTECKPCEYNILIWYKSVFCKEPVVAEPLKCIYNSSILLTDKDCKPCEYNLLIWYKSPSCKKPPVAEPLKCIYNSSILLTDKDCKPCEYNLLIWYKSPSCKKPPVVLVEEKCSLNPNLLASDPKCLSCPGNETVWINDISCTPNIVKSKTAINITQNNVDASSVIANAGDKISYTITTENIGINNASNVAIDENLSDLYDYSSLYDNGGGLFDSGSLTLSWPKITLSPKEKQTRTFIIKILDEIPSTAQGSSNEVSFDCIITNTFGNSINIKVNCPAPKLLEQTVTALPVTGPRDNILFSGITLAIVTYFYARARQQRKEIFLIRKDINTGTI